MDSRQKFTDDASIDVGDAIVTPLMTISEVFVVETEEVEDGGMEVVHVHLVFDRPVTEFIGGSVGESAFGSAASQPHCETIGIMVTSITAFV